MHLGIELSRTWPVQLHRFISGRTPTNLPGRLDAGPVRGSRVAGSTPQSTARSIKDEDFTKGSAVVQALSARECHNTPFNVDEAELIFQRSDPEVKKASNCYPCYRPRCLDSAKK